MMSQSLKQRLVSMIVSGSITVDDLKSQHARHSSAGVRLVAEMLQRLDDPNTPLLLLISLDSEIMHHAAMAGLAEESIELALAIQAKAEPVLADVLSKLGARPIRDPDSPSTGKPFPEGEKKTTVMVQFRDGITGPMFFHELPNGVVVVTSPGRQTIRISRHKQQDRDGKEAWSATAFDPKIQQRVILTAFSPADTYRMFMEQGGANLGY